MAFYNKETLDKLHKIEIGILSEIIRVCDILDIKWFTISGTTLGAIRHDGFIPWDDDIDIGMLRQDYDRFLKEAPALLNHDFSLCHYPLEKDYPLYFAKVRKNNTLFVEKLCHRKKMHHGVYVDIFPFDYIPNNENEQTALRKKIGLLNHLFLSKSLWGTSQPFITGIKKVKAQIARTVLRILLAPIPKRAIFNRMIKTVTQYNNNSDSSIVSINGSNRHNWSTSDIFPTQPHIFEDIIVQIPQNAHKLLTQEYGNYMELPPEDKRVAHAPVKIQL